MDLFRRDFTINALAIRLDCTPYGQLVDFFGGQRDIKEGVLRVLHTLSFVEDPTRSLRAVRFEQRYGFHIGPSAEKLIKNLLSLHMLDKLSGKRIFNEYTHICDEDDPAACFERLDGLGLLRALGPSLALTPSKRQIPQQVRSMLNWYRLLYFDERVENWLIYFLALGHRLNYAEVSANFTALGLPEGRKQEILQQRESMRHVQPKLVRWQKAFEAGTGRISGLSLLRKSSRWNSCSTSWPVWRTAGCKRTFPVTSPSGAVKSRISTAGIRATWASHLGRCSDASCGPCWPASWTERRRMRTASAAWRWTWPGRKAYFPNKRTASRAGLALGAQAVY